MSSLSQPRRQSCQGHLRAQGQPSCRYCPESCLRLPSVLRNTNSPQPIMILPFVHIFHAHAYVRILQIRAVEGNYMYRALQDDVAKGMSVGMRGRRANWNAGVRSGLTQSCIICNSLNICFRTDGFASIWTTCQSRITGIGGAGRSARELEKRQHGTKGSRCHVSRSLPF